MDRILPHICTASAYANIKYVLTQMQYIFAVTYETPSTNNNITVQNVHTTLSVRRSHTLTEATILLPLSQPTSPTAGCVCVCVCESEKHFVQTIVVIVKSVVK